MKESQGLDWHRVREQLLRFQDRLEHTGTVDEAKRTDILQHRADLLARPAATVDLTYSEDMILIFSLGAERYGVPVSQVNEVLICPRKTPVPGAPPEVSGVIQVRGEVRPVYDLSRILGIASRDSAEGEVVMVLAVDGQESGFSITKLEDIRTVPRDSRRFSGGVELISWMTEDLIPVLDANRLLKQQEA